ncbi:preprotein translocase subunit SecG [candidate division WWE3 bacterium RIFCSPHIGHO2_01_FULL_42_13]|uniref:Protein-export membrane protein SecG n=1 Tax=candidate division WWE3 bacterium RIFCSPHIGHO2_01_FULL_42_13 TaxID=1802617 RepID=A0A1F4UQG3_UNCKA|nr:MAG: preprotein translocase subunit SecG [candidate division WWE3 bacterium RIFCSPHIGHO2_01_FULL_42_13]
MNFLNLSKLLQILLAALLTLFVLIQSKGIGLSSAFSNVGGFYRTRRGVEKLIFGLTVTFGVIFVINSLVIVFLS